MDTPAPQHDPGLESRVFRLEEDMGGVRESLARIEAVLPHLATAAQVSDLRADLGTDLGGRISDLRADVGGQISDLRADMGGQISDLRADMGGQISELRADMGGQISDLRAGQGGQILELRGRMNHLPTTWQMMTGIVAGQCTLAALLAAIVFGVLKVTGHG
jgi:hypothetical protein